MIVIVIMVVSMPVTVVTMAMAMAVMMPMTMCVIFTCFLPAAHGTLNAEKVNSLGLTAKQAPDSLRHSHGKVQDGVTNTRMHGCVYALLTCVNRY